MSSFIFYLFLLFAIGCQLRNDSASMHRFWTQSPWHQIPASPLGSCILGQLFNLFVYQVLYTWRKCSKISFLKGMLWGLVFIKALGTELGSYLILKMITYIHLSLLFCLPLSPLIFHTVILPQWPRTKLECFTKNLCNFKIYKHFYVHKNMQNHNVHIELKSFRSRRWLEVSKHFDYKIHSSSFDCCWVCVGN